MILLNIQNNSWPNNSSINVPYDVKRGSGKKEKEWRNGLFHQFPIYVLNAGSMVSEVLPEFIFT